VSEKLVIIPTYNEKENITDMVHQVMALTGGYHLLVVDDSSPDGTGAMVKGLQEQYTGRLHLMERAGKQGLGTAYLAGFAWAVSQDYTYVFEMDADFSHNPKDLERLYTACAAEGNHLAVGSRYIKGVNVVNWPMGRVLLSYFASVYVRFVTGMPIMDATAGFKCYHRSVLEMILAEEKDPGIRFIGYAFQIEMKFLAWKYGFKIKEVDIVFTDRTRGKSKMSTGIVREAVLGVIRLKVNSLFRRYLKPVAN